mgnify:CR=1 FL=1
MRIGIPKEIKTNENRVSLVPAGAEALVAAGHAVMVEKGAGLGSGFSDEQYTAVGATIGSSAAKVWADAEMIIKVKEPIAKEWKHMKKGQTIFTYFHFAADEKLTKADIGKEVVLFGWVNNRRDHGGVIFIDLRDREGLVQVVFDPDRADSFKVAEEVRNEFCLKITGIVRARPAGTENAGLTSGKIEILAHELEVLNASVTPPFQLDDEGVDEAADAAPVVVGAVVDEAAHQDSPHHERRLRRRRASSVPSAPPTGRNRPCAG